MRKSSYAKLTIFIAISIILLSIIPTVQGWGRHQRSNYLIRSLDDWFYDAYGNPMNTDIGGWFSGTGSQPMIMIPHLDPETMEWTVIWEHKYCGFVLEKEMSDGRHLISVNLAVKRVPVIVDTIDPDLGRIRIFEGMMNYVYQLKFIIDIEVWTFLLSEIWEFDDDGFDDNGNVLLPYYIIAIPWQFPMGPEYGIEFVSISLFGFGTGVIFNSWNGLEPGDHAKTGIGQLGIAKEDLAVEWPIDFIKVF